MSEEFANLIIKAGGKPPAKLLQPPPETFWSRLLKLLRRVATLLRRFLKRREAKMPLVYHSDGTASIIKEEELTTAENLPVVVARPIPPQSKPPKLEVEDTRPRWNRPLVAVAFLLYGCATATNIWNAWGSDLATTAIPLAIAIGAETGLLFTMPMLGVGPVWKRVLAFVACAVFLVFALQNSLTLTSTAATDTAMARAERSTAGTERASAELDRARAARDAACGAGQSKSKACQLRADDVTRLEASARQARTDVAKMARPGSTDFARLIAWVSFGRIVPTPDDYDMLWLLLRTLIPQMGGVLLLLARR